MSTRERNEHECNRKRRDATEANRATQLSTSSTVNPAAGEQIETFSSFTLRKQKPRSFVLTRA
jgi:hypothetical protein